MQPEQAESILADMFNVLLDRFEWVPIRGCPGRFVLARGIVAESIQQLIGQDAIVRTIRSPKTSDPVCICHFPGGGMISYRKKDGYLHTLCSEEGMRRKLEMLRK